MNSSVRIATQPWSRLRPDLRLAAQTPRCPAAPAFAELSALSARAAKATFLHLLALCLLSFSAEALAARDGRIARDAETIRIDARLQVNAHHHIAWQVLTDYDNLARFVPGLTSSRIVSEPGAPLLL